MLTSSELAWRWPVGAWGELSWESSSSDPEVTRIHAERWPSQARGKQIVDPSFQSQASARMEASFGLAKAHEKGTKQAQVGSSRPGQGLTTQPNRPYILYVGQSLLSLFSTQNGPIWAGDAHACGLGLIIPTKSSGLRKSDHQAASKFSQLSRALVHLIRTCLIEEDL